MLKALLRVCEDAIETMVEVEFAMALDEHRGAPARFGFLQVRPMIVSQAKVDVSLKELAGEKVLVASESALGNGSLENIRDVVYIKPQKFGIHHSNTIATELELLNRPLVASNSPYVLIGFGRWGTSDPQAGIPVNFGQICAAKVIVEFSLPETSTMLSQGSHFFHNITSFKVFYFSLSQGDKYRIDWDWLDSQKTVRETEFVRHVILSSPLKIKVDGRTSRGVIFYE
jgi:hypothetical protein